MLLQYIIFPLNTNPNVSVSTSPAVTGHPTCELWVEPQYGTVTQAPAGLQYILGCTHKEIADKVHVVYIGDRNSHTGVPLSPPICQSSTSTEHTVASVVRATALKVEGHGLNPT